MIASSGFPAESFPEFSAAPPSPAKTIVSPSKSRIPVSANRIAKPSIIPTVLTLHEIGSSPIKPILKHISPARAKIRVKGKAKSGSQGKVPLTRQAVKKGLRHLSSVKDLKAVIPVTNDVAGAATSNAFLPLQSKQSEGLHQREFAKMSKEDPKSPVMKKTTIFTGPPLNSRPHTSLPDSPNKPTPLLALSTALQKLGKTPPSAPPPRAHPNGFSRPCCPPTLPVVMTSTPKTPQPSSGSQYPPVSHPKTTNPGQNDVSSPNKAMNKTGLPARRPSAADLVGRTVIGPFASKKTTLSTVPASPSKSATSVIPPFQQSSNKKDGPSVRHVAFDVDAWTATKNDKGKNKESEVNIPEKIEYFVSLAGESHNKPPPPQISPSRRASQASLSLTQSLGMPRPPGTSVPGRSVSLSHLHLNPRTPVKTRGRIKPPLPSETSDPMAGKRMNAKMPGSLNVLKDCVVFVDIRTEDGEDSSALFVDMLRGLGARVRFLLSLNW